MMVHQMCAPNSPQWFNTGLNYAYGITGPSQGYWIVNAKTGKPASRPTPIPTRSPTPASSRASRTTW